jgi:hypothetical protein
MSSYFRFLPQTFIAWHLPKDAKMTGECPPFSPSTSWPHSVSGGSSCPPSATCTVHVGCARYTVVVRLLVRVRRPHAVSRESNHSPMGASTVSTLCYPSQPKPSLLHSYFPPSCQSYSQAPNYTLHHQRHQPYNKNHTYRPTWGPLDFHQHIPCSSVLQLDNSVPPNHQLFLPPSYCIDEIPLRLLPTYCFAL